MYWIAVLVSLVAVECARRSPNSDLVGEILKAHTKVNFSNDVIEDAFLDAPGLIKKYGYPVETHHVLTSDDYVLEAHRIPHGRDQNNKPVRGKRVVFLFHGLFASSANFLVLGPGNSIAYLLAERGYDVWLGNARGNFYSHRHLHMNTTEKKFWRFSWEQIGMHDLAALVDYIILKTGQSKMHYIGHSQGGTSFLVLNSMRPEYNKKFISFQGFAPASYFDNNKEKLFRILAPLEKIIEASAFLKGYAEILPRSNFFKWIAVEECADYSMFQPICAQVFIYTMHYHRFNETLTPIFIGHIAGASIRQVTHYLQTIRRKTFGRFDFNPVTNLKVYQSLTPPDFNMSLITVPAYLHYGLSDREVNHKDLHILSTKLGNTVGVYGVKRKSFNHYDFLWGRDVKNELYLKVFELMKDAESKSVKKLKYVQR